MQTKLPKKGFSLVEMLIYVSILSVISVIVVNLLISMTSTYRTVVALRIAENAGINTMERITRDLRAAGSLDLGESNLGNNPGALGLVFTGGPVSTERFYMEGGILKLDINGAYFGPLTFSNVTVTNLVFRLMDSGVSQAVKIDMTLEGHVGATVKTKTFHSTVILRGE